MLIIFNPARTAAAHPPAGLHLVDADDADELAQVLFPRPATADRDALNRVLGLMGTAKGVIAFSSSLASEREPSPSPFHYIASKNNRTVIFRPRQDTVILAIFPVSDATPPQAQLEALVRSGWDTSCLLFGPDPWDQRNDQASDWWDRWAARVFSQAQEYGIHSWITGQHRPMNIRVHALDPNDPSTPAQIATDLRNVAETIAATTKTSPRTHVISLSHPAADAHPTATIYTSPQPHKPLTHHLLEALVLSSHPSHPEKRARKRSPPPSEPRHHASKWTTLNLGIGIGIGFGGLFPSSSSSPSTPAPTAATQPSKQRWPSMTLSSVGLSRPTSGQHGSGNSGDGGGGGVTKWLGLRTDPIPPDSPADDPVQHPRVDRMDLDGLRDALGGCEAGDVGSQGMESAPQDGDRDGGMLEWFVRDVWLPSGDDADHGSVRDGTEDSIGATPDLRRYTLGYTITGCTLVGFVTDQLSPDALSEVLRGERETSDENNDHPSRRIQKPVQALGRHLSAHAPPRSLSQEKEDARSTQYIHFTPTHITSLWPAPAQVINTPQPPPAKRDDPIKVRRSKEVTVDQAVVGTRQWLIQIDGAREVFARTNNDLWIAGRRVRSSVNGGQSGSADEAYLVTTGKDTSIVDAEYQLRQIVKGRQG